MNAKLEWQMTNAFVYLVKYFLEHGLDFSGTAHICLEWNAHCAFIACSNFNFLANLKKMGC